MNAPQSPPATSSQGNLGLWDTASIIVGIVIGTTIFELPWLIFMNTPNPWVGLAVWVFGGFLSLMGALCYAELASTYPRDGGDYYYLTRAFGRLTGFLFGWAQLVVILPASIGVMAFVFANLATEMTTFPDVAGLGLNSEFYYASLAVLVISLLNILGVVMGKTVQNILTLAKILGLLAILVAGFFAPSEQAHTDWTLPTYQAGNAMWGSLALILVLYAYGGWNDAAFVAAEVRDPHRNIPRALLLGIGSITLIYLLVNLAYIVGLGFPNTQKPGSLPMQLLTNMLGENAGKVMGAIIMASALGAVNGLIFTGSRVYATVGQDHRLFGFLGHWRPNRGAPIMALLIQALITIGLVLIFGTHRGHEAINSLLVWLNQTLGITIDFKSEWKPREAFGELVSHSAPAFWVFFGLTAMALFALREKDRTQTRPFSVPLFPLVPIIFFNMCAYMLYASVNYIGWRTSFVVVLLVLGIPVYFISESLGRPREESSMR